MYKLLKLNFAISLVLLLSSWWQQPLTKTYATLLPLGKPRAVEHMLSYS